MSIDLLNLPAREAETLAYSEGFANAAVLLGRVADAQDAQRATLAQLKAVLKAATQGDREELTRAVFDAYVHLDKLGVNDDMQTVTYDSTDASL